MSDKVLVVVPGLGILALTLEQLQEARRAGQELIGPPSTSSGESDSEPLLDASTLADGLGVPCSHIESLAVQGRIPSLKLGRYRRFKRSEVEAALANGRHS